SLGRGFTVQQSGATGIVVTGPKARAAERARIMRLVTQLALIRFYDWEANVLTPKGKTAASQLLTRDRSAVSLSQGANYGAGEPGAGSMPLYAAVKLAAKQPRAQASPPLSRLGPEYFVFGAPGSPACARVAAADHTRPVPGTHCLLAGSIDLGSDARLHQALAEAAARFPSGRIPGRTEVVVVPQGTTVLQAEQLHAAAPVPFDSPTAQFFVLRDRAALNGNQITHPTASTDQGGEPAVNFGFTGTGRSAFQRVTKQVAHRGLNVSLEGNILNQHFAVALDNQIVTVPQIDFRQYPDGVITESTGADVTGGLTPQTAKDLATELRYGALPLSVRVLP
ncbi:MAG: SecDF P1 head subdomain-containing protein, partial [Solirubrobacteraceae bacterium]